MSNWQGVEPQPVSLVYQGVPRKKWMIKPTNNGLRNKMLQIHFWSKKILPKLGCRQGLLGWKISHLQLAGATHTSVGFWMVLGSIFWGTPSKNCVFSPAFFQLLQTSGFLVFLGGLGWSFEFRLDPPKITRDCYLVAPLENSKLPGPKPPIYHQLKTGPRRVFPVASDSWGMVISCTSSVATTAPRGWTICSTSISSAGRVSGKNQVEPKKLGFV